MADTQRYVEAVLSWTRTQSVTVAVLKRGADDSGWTEIGRTDATEFTATGLHPERSYTFAVVPVETDEPAGGPLRADPCGLYKADAAPRELSGQVVSVTRADRTQELPMPHGHSDLFTPVTIGALTLPNRIVMAPLTRCRADADHVPTALMAEYYAQRASAGAIIAEATMVMAGHSSFAGREPGVFSTAQVNGWKRVTDAVHAAGGRILLQLWHGGRACHPYFNAGAQPVAPSALAITGDEIHTPEGKKPYVVPRALRDDELPAIVAGFGTAAANAKAAGFDGVEVHGANGYLLDEFLRDGANKRTGPYGGPIANRARLLLEVTDAVIAVWGAGRVGVRVSPLNSYNDMRDSDPVAVTAHVAAELSARHIAYLHVMRADFFQQQKGDVMTPARARFDGALVGNMGYSADEAAAAVASGALQAVAFGHHYVSNPDLVERIRAGVPLAEPDARTFYTQDAKGYTDYARM